MDNSPRLVHDPKRSRFLFGILFAWVPCLPFFVTVLRELAEAAKANKAIGLGAVAGGLSEWGLIAIIPLSAIAALILLPRSFSRGHWLRAIFATISMLWSALVLFGLGMFGWFLFTHRS